MSSTGYGDLGMSASLQVGRLRNGLSVEMLLGTNSFSRQVDVTMYGESLLPIVQVVYAHVAADDLVGLLSNGLCAIELISQDGEGASCPVSSTVGGAGTLPSYRDFQEQYAVHGSD